MDKMGEKGAVGMLVGVVVALIVGIAGGYAIGHNNSNNNNDTKASATTASSKAADLRSSLVTLGVEHMTLTNHAVDAALDGSKNASAVAAALYQNGDDIGAAVGSVYGKDAEKTFDSVWKLHLDQFVNYAVADSKGDSSAKQAALDKISTGYTKPLAAYLAKANPNFSESTLESALNDHVQMTATMIDDHVQGNYKAESDELKMANQHIEGIFSTLAEGIVKQYPAKF